MYVSDIECSPHDAATLYVTLDGHRSDDYAPHVFRSSDGGDSFERIDAGLPEDGSVRCVLPDPVNRRLLFLGTEFGCFASIDSGAHWMRWGGGLPTVPVTTVMSPTCAFHGDWKPGQARSPRQFDRLVPSSLVRFATSGAGSPATSDASSR